MIRISDARMSGTAYGTIVLHVTPEAAVGGPLSLVKNGDKKKLASKIVRSILGRGRVGKPKAKNGIKCHNKI